MDLRGKVALVTGASRRVGRAIALKFAGHGATVAVHYHGSHAEADAVVAEIARKRGKARAFRANLSTSVRSRRWSPACSTRSAESTSSSIPLRSSRASRSPKVTERDWDANLDTNLKAPFFLSKFAGAAMRRQGAGKIVNIGDWAGPRPYKDYLPYSVSKSGADRLDQGARQRTCARSAGELHSAGHGDAARGIQQGRSGAPRQSHADKKNGLAEDVARAVIFFCEEQTSPPARPWHWKAVACSFSSDAPSVAPARS